jgi:hypothetical protein
MVHCDAATQDLSPNGKTAELLSEAIATMQQLLVCMAHHCCFFLYAVPVVMKVIRENT